MGEERESGAMPGLAEAQWPEACAQFQSAWKRLAGEVSSSEDEDDRRRRQKCWERRVAGSKLVSPESKSYLVLEHIPFRGRSLKKKEKEKEKEKEKSDQLWEEEEEESGTEVFLKRQDESECVHLYDFHICYNGCYEVPELFFLGYRRDRSILSLEEVLDDLRGVTEEELSGCFLVKEHPLL